jgi:copper resistance protein B
MKKLLILLLAASVSAPALAQHEGHTQPQQPAKEQAKAAESAPDPDGGHGRPSSTPTAAPAPPADPHAGHNMPAPAPAQAPAADPHAGHVMPTPAPAAPPAPAADPHAGHDIGGMGEEIPAPPVAPPPPGALSGPAHAADTIYDAEAMTEARRELRVGHGSMQSYKILIDQLETRIRNGRDGYFLNAEAWYGGDINKLWLKSEIEGSFGKKPEQAEFQALWSHAIDPWFNLQGGVRYDAQPGSGRSHLVLGIQGLAPYWFEVDGAAFLSDKGDLTARFEAEYDQRLTQKLILQPRVELDFSFQDIPAERVGGGLSTVAAGLRLRYEFVPEFAPYIGVEYDRALAGTARFNRAAGDDVGGWSLVLGVRTWF